jgi:hypothetical protein
MLSTVKNGVRKRVSMTEEKRPARPWDIFNKNLNNVPEEDFHARMAICKKCEFFIKKTSQCSKCGCFMSLKTKLVNASCPVGKWGTIDVSIEEK